MATLNYRHFGGQYSETAALANVLAYSGLHNPATNQPLSEAMLLGIGGGVGAAYFMFEFGGSPSIYIGTRWHSSSGDFMQAIIQRLGLDANIKQTAGGKGAAKHLQEALAQGRPAILSLDRASLPYQAYSPDYIKYMIHTAVVFGMDEDAGIVYMGDKAAAPLTVTTAELAAARAAITGQLHRLITIAPEANIDLPAAITEGIHACIKSMTEPTIANFGLKSLLKWAQMMIDPKDKKAWPTLLPAGERLFSILRWVFPYIETYDTPGSAFRTMYADFLDEASSVLQQPALPDIAAQYRQLAKQWHNIAEAALPNSVPAFAETKRLLRQKNQLFAAQGMDAVPQMRDIESRLADIKQQVAADFPLSPTEIADLRQSLHDQVIALHAGEAQAIEALQAAIA